VHVAGVHGQLEDVYEDRPAPGTEDHGPRGGAQVCRATVP